MVERWSAEDSAENRDRLALADRRIEAWARWQRTASPDKLSYPCSCSFGRAMSPGDEEAQAGARHLKTDLSCTDEEALEVDAVLSDWRTHHRAWWKVVRKEYLTMGPSEKKARELGITRAEYRRQLDLLRMAMWKELDAGARSARKPGKLAELPERNARS